MSKKALLMLPISLIVISTASCSWLFGKTKDDIIREQNPGYIVGKVTTRSDFYYENDEYDSLLEDDDNAVLNKLKNVDDFTYVNKQPALSDEYFIYYAKTPGFMGYYTKEITIYENGYASTVCNSSQSEYHGTYYYQFDEDVAKSLLTMVKDKYKAVIEEIKRQQEERDRVEAEYNQMIEDMTIFTVIEKMKEERVDLEFSFLTDEEDPRYYRFTFRDDGSIYTSLKNATYSESNHNTYIDEYDSLNHLFIQGNEWKIEIHKKARTVHVTFETHDKYGRSYKYDDDKIIDEDSLNAILNKAYELSAPKNPFGDSSSNPSSSSEE